MKPLNTDSYPDQSMRFGLVLQLACPARRQFHIAAIYWFNNVLKIGDLQSHLKTRCAPVEPTENAFWFEPDIDLEDQRLLAAKIDVWLTENENKIPYSVASPDGVLFKDDIWVGSALGQGLTCATFIVALFDELGYPFLDVSSWKLRDGDEEWAKGILELLQRHCGLAKDHASVQKELIGDGIRVRPTDVFAAGLLINEETEKPLLFDQVDPKTKEVELNTFP